MTPKRLRVNVPLAIKNIRFDGVVRFNTERSRSFSPRCADKGVFSMSVTRRNDIAAVQEHIDDSLVDKHYY